MKRRREGRTWREPAPLGEELRRELARLGPAGAATDLASVWPDAVGAAVARNAWPARVARDGTLHVSTSSSAWAFELTQLEATVRERLRERLGERTPPRLRFAVGPLPEPGREEVSTSARTVPKVSQENRDEAERLAAEIADDKLRGLVARAAAASLARERGEVADRRLW